MLQSMGSQRVGHNRETEQLLLPPPKLVMGLRKAPPLLCLSSFRLVDTTGGNLAWATSPALLACSLLLLLLGGFCHLELILFLPSALWGRRSGFSHLKYPHLRVQMLPVSISPKACRARSLLPRMPFCLTHILIPRDPQTLGLTRFTQGTYFKCISSSFPWQSSG